MKHAFTITRRTALSLIAFASLTGASAKLARASGKNFYQTELKKFLLKTKLPDPSDTLTLVRFDVFKDSGATVMRAVVKLKWSPGMRQRLYSARSGDPDFAFAILLATIDDVMSNLS